jgi:putative phosphoesterase
MPASPAGPLLTLGVLSDTHGHLYAPVARMLEGVDHIIHAGDICSLEVLSRLRGIAPVTAVRGNCDNEAWAAALPHQAEIELAGVRFSVTHVGGRRPAGAASPVPDGPEVVVTGHTHLAALEQRGQALYLNPGSAGPRRFGRPRTLARVEIFRGPDGSPRVRAELITIEE